MSGMGDGYVGTSQDGVRIRRLQKQREAERRKIQELKSKTASGQEQSGLLQFGSSSCEILDTAFKKETVGLVTREEYVEKRVNIRNKFEEEEKEKLLKLLQEEEELQQQKRSKKRKLKGSSRLSFAEDLEDGSDDDDDAENKSSGNLRYGKLGKDPSVETNFLPDSEREAEEQAERERLKKQWTREQEQIKNEPLQITYSYWDGTGHRRVIQASTGYTSVRKGDPIGNFLRAVQQQLAPDFREIRTASVENLLYVKEDLIIPHQHSFYELIINKARGKSGPLFHFDVHEDVRTIADATIEKDESHAGKVVERHWYEKNKHIFPASRWEKLDRSIDFYLLHFVSTVARCQVDAEDHSSIVDDVVGEHSDSGAEEDDQDLDNINLTSAPGVETVSVFPKNSAKVVPAGEETELLVAIKNDGKSHVGVMGIRASVHLPYDHKLLVQNLTMMRYNNASIPTSVQATFPYIFAVSQYLQPGAFDLVGYIIYDVEGKPYQSVFYNGTIEVVESGGLLSGESVFLITLGIALLLLLGLWAYSQVQRLTKKTKKVSKVEVGTRSTDASMDEWLEGTHLAKTLSGKSKSKKN
ncbi:hypothetical protein HID58_036223 [Brassica napus]|uniref:FAM50A/XAP5 C-terminal domain-containing protein n=1 Tax=Brassica napus TaxID=3708 RepID=A0ABQ8C747_BRANA|nr:hypothetical protein HID58_036223 [Brassica napus]